MIEASRPLWLTAEVLYQPRVGDSSVGGAPGLFDSPNWQCVIVLIKKTLYAYLSLIPSNPLFVLAQHDEKLANKTQKKSSAVV